MGTLFGSTGSSAVARRQRPVLAFLERSKLHQSIRNLSEVVVDIVGEDVCCNESRYG